MLMNYIGIIVSYEKCNKEYEDIRVNFGIDDGLKIFI